MKKSSTAMPAALPRSVLRALPLVAGAACLIGGFALPSALAQSATQAQGSQARKPPTLADNAPDRYIVERGDTLWGIAGKFLKEPWRWPDLWNMNRDTVRNPNRIFPGDVLVLDRTRGTLSVAQSDTVKLSPQVRQEALASSQAIPPIPPRVIEPFLTQPLVIEAGGLASAPRIIGAQESRVNLGAGGVAYVSGIKETSPGQLWNIYRPGNTLIDPDTRAALGVEAIFLGTAKVTRQGEPATVEIVSSRQEISLGDRMVLAAPAGVPNYVPHAPANYLQGRIIGLYNGLPTSETGARSVVAINLGRKQGLENGHVLSIVRSGSFVTDPEAYQSRDLAPAFKLPDERYGTLFVFRVFDAVSYALVMESSRPVTPADIVQTPPAQ